jgi:hypothetical protein
MENGFKKAKQGKVGKEIRSMTHNYRSDIVSGTNGKQNTQIRDKFGGWKCASSGRELPSKYSLPSKALSSISCTTKIITIKINSEGRAGRT